MEHTKDRRKRTKRDKNIYKNWQNREKQSTSLSPSDYVGPKIKTLKTEHLLSEEPHCILLEEA